uniref:Histone deacetylase n=1 Tax=Oryza glumipatula TaxID=40148 RepID=A0A0D9YB25_9ORYZ
MAMAGGGGNSLPSPSCGDDKKRRVCYYYDPGISTVDYGEGHVMVPHRVTMAHNLVAAYGMLGDMRRLRTAPATAAELADFHDEGYLALLQDLTPDDCGGDDGIGDMARARGIYAVEGKGGGRGVDNPVFDRLWDYCLRYSGGSLAAARALGSGTADVAINWSGGMHHACRGGARGFCYVNDIVLAIRELLAHFRRVLYVDIDVHHGDGVEAAFEASNRVMTVSFHQHGGGFFPCSGAVADVGKKGPGQYCALNVPVSVGIGDEEYHRLFEPIMARVMEVFQPEAVVLQCGADSLAGDRLGELNLTTRGHAQCVSFIRSFNLPLLLLGGGGYTINHVASCWCNETAVAIGKEIPNDIPKHGFDVFYKNQEYKLHYKLETKHLHRNRNTANSIDGIRMAAMENLSKLKLEAAASVQFEERRHRSIDVGDLYYDPREQEEEEESPTARLHRKLYFEPTGDQESPYTKHRCNVQPGESSSRKQRKLK